MASDLRIQQLRAVPAFSACSPRELAFAARLVDELSFEPGAVLVREGRIGHECFVIASGEAVVSIDAAPIATVGAGDIVGEMALALQEPRVATVTARTHVDAYVMSAQAFTSMLDHCPSVGRHVLQTVAHRLREFQAA